jgi:hypothetical protein
MLAHTELPGKSKAASLSEPDNVEEIPVAPESLVLLTEEIRNVRAGHFSIEIEKRAQAFTSLPPGAIVGP